MSMRVRTEDAECQTGKELLPIEFVDVGEEMLEKRMEYLRMERKKRSSTVSGRSSSQSHRRPPGINISSLKRDTDLATEPKSVYFRETEHLKAKGINNCSIGVQCDLKLAHPHFRALQAQVNELKADLEKKNKIIQRQSDSSTYQINELKAELKKLAEEKVLIQKQTQATYEMYNKEKVGQAAQKMSK